MKSAIIFMAAALSSAPAFAFDPIEGAVTSLSGVGSEIMKGGNGLIPQGAPIPTQSATSNYNGPSNSGPAAAISCAKAWNPFMQQNVYTDRRASDAVCGGNTRSSVLNSQTNGTVKLNADVQSDIKSLSATSPSGVGSSPTSLGTNNTFSNQQAPTGTSTFVNCDAVRAPLEQEFQSVNGDYGQMLILFKRMWLTWPIECRYSNLKTDQQARDYENSLIAAENAKVQAEIAAQQQVRIQQYQFRPPVAPSAPNPNCQQALNSLLNGTPGYGSYERAQQIGNWYNANCLR